MILGSKKIKDPIPSDIEEKVSVADDIESAHDDTSSFSEGSGRCDRTINVPTVN